MNPSHIMINFIALRLVHNILCSSLFQLAMPYRLKRLLNLSTASPNMTSKLPLFRWPLFSLGFPGIYATKMLQYLCYTCYNPGILCV